MIQRIFAFIKFVLIFLREVWMANVTVVKQVLSPTLKIRPGFISVPMTVRGDFEVTSYANSMTLTPGTIAVHIPEDRHAIVLHAMDIGDDADAIRQSCTNILEKNILRWSRGEAAAATAGGIGTTPAAAPASATPPADSQTRHSGERDSSDDDQPFKGDSI